MNNCRVYLKEISVCAFKQIVRPLSIDSICSAVVTNGEQSGLFYNISYRIQNES